MTSTTPQVQRSRRGFLGLAGRTAVLGAATVAGGAAAPFTARAASASVPLAAAEGSGAAGGEVAYAETLAPASTKTAVLVPNLALVIGPHDRPISIEYGGYVSSTAANGVVMLRLFQDTKIVHEAGCSTPGVSGIGHLHGYRRLAPSATSVTFALALANGTTGATASLLAFGYCPAFLQVRDL